MFVFLLGGLQCVFMETNHKMNVIGSYKVMSIQNILC